MKLTPWYPADIKPLHVGAYLSKEIIHGKFYRYWDGAQWGAAARTIQNAIILSDISWAYQNNVWRGLARKP